MNSRIYPRVCAIHLLIAALSGSLLSAGETLRNDALGFTLMLPDGLTQCPNPFETGDVVRCYSLGEPQGDQVPILLAIQSMRGVIGRERLKPEDLPPDFKGRLFTAKWKKFEIDGFEIPEVIGDLKTITYNVQVPLKPRAIQFKVFGPADREAELKTLLTSALDGLQGESNWLESASPGGALTSSRYYGYVLLATAIVMILVGLIGLWLVSKRGPRGAALGVAVAFYLGSAAFKNSDVRELVMLCGAMRLFGVIGCVLGLVDLFRKRPPKDGNAPPQETQPSDK